MLIAVIVLAVLALVFAIVGGVYFFRWRKTYIAFRLSVTMLDLVKDDYQIPDWQIEGHYLQLADQKIKEQIEQLKRK